MRPPAPRSALVLALALACNGNDKDGTGPGTDTAPTGPGLDDNFGETEGQGTPGCDNLLPACLVPYPSRAYIDGEGRVVTPTNPFDGATVVDPAPISRHRGFGAATPILFMLPTDGAPAVPPAPGPFDSAASLGDDAATFVIDAATGERIPHWVEGDYLSPDLDPPLLVIRPAVPLPRGTEIVVGVRGVTDGGGAVIEAPEAFRALRDRTVSDWIGVHDRRQQYEDVVFPTLEAAGVAREELQLAWSFPVQSDADATTPLIALRDAVFGALPAGGPTYTLDNVEVCDGIDDSKACHPSIRVVVDGTVQVPSGVLPADDIGLRTLRLDAAGAPIVEGVETWPFRLQLPNSAFDGADPVPVMQYGHGFLGSASEADNDWYRQMADRLGFAILACDMQGMNEDILQVWLEVLVNQPGKFPLLQDLPMQGTVNQLVQQRLVGTSLAQDPNPALYRDDGRLAWDPTTVWYYGNSQGGSVGTVVMGTTLDVQRGVLGVPGSGYPLLLHRSTVFLPFVDLISITNTADDAVPNLLALLGTGWDWFDPLTFAPHLHGNPLPGTPDHEVLYHVAKEDQQVVNEASFISARSVGAVLMTPAVRPVYGLPEVAYPASPGAAVVEVDFGIPDDPTPEDPPEVYKDLPSSGDTHGWLRKWPPAQDQLVHFLRTGEVIDVCGGVPCVTGPQ